MTDRAGFHPPFFMGVDVGGTTIKIGVVDDMGQSMSKCVVPTEAQQAVEVGMANLERCAHESVQQAGYPITDERVTSDGRGRFNHFRGMQYPNRPESSIFWSPQNGAHAIYGAIREAWAQQGWERGPLGYPTSDEYQDGKYRRVNFERGHIVWAPDTGVQVRQ